MTSSIECKNFLRSLQLLHSFADMGVEFFILCPGSRSAPLALAAGEICLSRKIKLFNSIDERSAGFHALGLSSASGKKVIVITTSGTAVANLLPSAVEADRSCKSIIYLTADRPLRLKNCGANQTVNQEEFLLAACKVFLSTNLNGLHNTSNSDIQSLLNVISKKDLSNTGPIHLNIPLEKPLIISSDNKEKTLEVFKKEYQDVSLDFCKKIADEKNGEIFEEIFSKINFTKPGLIIVGPYRGALNDLLEFNNSLEKLQKLTGWPVFADPVSGVDPSLRGLVEHWELIIHSEKKDLGFNQLLRLGPTPTSSVLDKFLGDFNGWHVLIKENDSRNLDPLKKAVEYEFGLHNFVKNIIDQKYKNILEVKSLIPLASYLIKKGKRIKNLLKNKLLLDDHITELSLANLVPKIWPKNNPIMISASSPIRDWLTFSGNEVLTRRCFSFRGASGIDGTLSIALGIARIINPLLLVTGDLSFLHDINGWLNQDAKDINLKILLIDNKGGNIFNRLYKNNLNKKEIEQLFSMERNVNWEKLAETHNIPFLNVLSLKKLKQAFEWGLSIPKSVIIRVEIDIDYEIKQREDIYDFIFKDQ